MCIIDIVLVIYEHGKGKKVGFLNVCLFECASRVSVHALKYVMYSCPLLQ